MAVNTAIWLILAAFQPALHSAAELSFYITRELCLEASSGFLLNVGFSSAPWVSYGYHDLVPIATLHPFSAFWIVLASWTLITLPSTQAMYWGKWTS